MDTEKLVGDLKEQLRERPYWTLAAVAGVGWVLGRGLPVTTLLALGGLGARAALGSAIEGAVRHQMRPAETKAT